MNLNQLNIPVVWAAGIILFTISSVITVEFRYANAGDVESAFRELNTSVQVNAKENRLLILQMQLFRAETSQEKQFLKAQIDQLLREIAALRN